MYTMKTILILALAILFVIPSFSQSSETDSLSKANISQLEFMVGNWKGSGWMMGRDGQRGEDWMQFFEMTLDRE